MAQPAVLERARRDVGDRTVPESVDRAWIDICSVDDLRAGEGVAALVGGGQVALFSTGDGAVHALDNVDPFSGASVLSRGLLGERGGRWYVASPLYKQRFDLATGTCLDVPDRSVAVWPVRLNAGRVQLNNSAAARA